jgi:hypothetical protein
MAWGPECMYQHHIQLSLQGVRDNRGHGEGRPLHWAPSADAVAGNGAAGHASHQGMLPAVGHEALCEEMGSFGTIAERHTCPFLRC